MINVSIAGSVITVDPDYNLLLNIFIALIVSILSYYISALGMLVSNPNNKVHYMSTVKLMKHLNSSTLTDAPDFDLDPCPSDYFCMPLDFSEHHHSSFV